MQSVFSKLINHPQFWRHLVIWSGLFIGAYCFLKSLGIIVFPFFAGGIAAYLLDKPTSYLETFKLPRSLIAAFLILLLFVVIFSFSFTVLPYIQDELLDLMQYFPILIESLMKKWQPLLAYFSRKNIDIHSLQAQLSAYLGDVVKWFINALVGILSSGLVVANFISLIILTPLVTFYLLCDWKRILDFVENFLSEKNAIYTKKIAKKIDKTLTSYLKGQSMVCCILSLIYCLGLWLIGLPNPFLIGCLTGFLSFIPYVGALIGLIISLAIVFTHYFSISMIFQVMGIFATAQLIDGYYLTPHFISEKIGLHPLWLLFALLAGGTWFGFLGVVIAIPTVAILGVLVKEIYHFDKKISQN